MKKLFLIIGIFTYSLSFGQVVISLDGESSSSMDSTEIIPLVGRVIDTSNFAANASIDNSADSGISYYNGGFGVYELAQPFAKYFTTNPARYYVNRGENGSVGTVAMPNGTIYAWPIMFPPNATFDTVITEIVANGSGGRFYVWGLYDNLNDTIVYPGTKLFQSGQCSAETNATTTTTITAFTPNPSKLYWIVMNGNNANPTMRAMGVSSSFPNILGFSSGATGPSNCLSYSLEYNATLPTTFGATYLTATYNSKKQPLLLWKR